MVLVVKISNTAIFSLHAFKCVFHVQSLKYLNMMHSLHFLILYLKKNKLEILYLVLFWYCHSLIFGGAQYSLYRRVCINHSSHHRFGHATTSGLFFSYMQVDRKQSWVAYNLSLNLIILFMHLCED